MDNVLTECASQGFCRSKHCIKWNLVLLFLMRPSMKTLEGRFIYMLYCTTSLQLVQQQHNNIARQV